MRIGVYRSGQAPGIGGGFTFEDDAFAALVEAADRSRHSFTFYSHVDARPANAAERLRFIVLNKTKSTGRVRLLLGRAARRLGRRAGTAEALDHSSVVRGQVDVMLYLTPLEMLSREVPYIVPTWDLQHRLQPYFPEVSVDGRWETRERYFSTHLRRAAYVVTGTAAGKAEVEQFYQVPASRIRVLRHPTPQFALDAATRPTAPFPNRDGLAPGYLLYPAQFWAHKNHASLLFALRTLEDETGLRPHAVFVGSDHGNRGHVVRLIAELGLQDRVHLLGFVSRDELISLYQHALAMPYMSLFGPENLPPLEAFALGCPVIATRVDGAEEQLGSAALIVDGTESRAVADAIRRVHNDGNLRATLIANGRKRASEFTAADFAAGLLSIVDEFEPIRRCWT